MRLGGSTLGEVALFSNKNLLALATVKRVSERLAMGHFTRVSQAISQVKRRSGRKHEQIRRLLSRAVRNQPAARTQYAKIIDSAEKPGGYFLVLGEAGGAAKRLSRRSERLSNCH